MTDKSAEDRFRHRNEGAETDADVEGHKFRHGPAEPVEGEGVKDDATDDTPDVEGHRFRHSPAERARH